jgi:hypothetical protein
VAVEAAVVAPQVRHLLDPATQDPAAHPVVVLDLLVVVAHLVAAHHLP